jgi:hypothetical protein
MIQHRIKSERHEGLVLTEPGVATLGVARTSINLSLKIRSLP